MKPITVTPTPEQFEAYEGEVMEVEQKIADVCIEAGVSYVATLAASLHIASFCIEKSWGPDAKKEFDILMENWMAGSDSKEENLMATRGKQLTMMWGDTPGKVDQRDKTIHFNSEKERHSFLRGVRAALGHTEYVALDENDDFYMASSPMEIASFARPEPQAVDVSHENILGAASEDGD